MKNGFCRVLHRDVRVKIHRDLQRRRVRRCSNDDGESERDHATRVSGVSPRIERQRLQSLRAVHIHPRADAAPLDNLRCMTLPLQRLEGFYWVARTEGYARAARSFPYPITQPGVHQQVKRLETELGVELFERVGKDRVVLTPAGRTLYTFVAPFFEQLPSIVSAVKGGDAKGVLKVHASGLVLRYLLPAWLRRVQTKRPLVELVLSEARTADLSVLRSGEADLLVDHLADIPEDIEVKEVGRAHAFIAVPTSYPLTRDGRVAIDALRNEPFVAYNTDKALRSLQLEALREHNITPRRILAADSAETILGFVAAGVGYSLVPWLQPTGPKVTGVVSEKLMKPARSFPVYAAWRKTSARNPLILAALEEAPSPTQ